MSVENEVRELRRRSIEHESRIATLEQTLSSIAGELLSRLPGLVPDTNRPEPPEPGEGL